MSQKLNISQLFRERMRRDSDNQLEAWLLWEFICGSVGRDEILHHRLKPGDDVNLDYSLTIDGRKTDLTDLLDRIVSHFETRVEEHAKAEIAEGIRDRKELLDDAIIDATKKIDDLTEAFEQEVCDKRVLMPGVEPDSATMVLYDALRLLWDKEGRELDAKVSDIKKSHPDEPSMGLHLKQRLSAMKAMLTRWTERAIEVKKRWY